MGDEEINRELRLSDELDERYSLQDPDLVEVSRNAWLSDSSAKLERNHDRVGFMGIEHHDVWR